jgi:hypothetical protein
MKGLLPACILGPKRLDHIIQNSFSFCGSCTLLPNETLKATSGYAHRQKEHKH